MGLRREREEGKDGEEGSGGQRGTGNEAAGFEDGEQKHTPKNAAVSRKRRRQENRPFSVIYVMTILQPHYELRSSTVALSEVRDTAPRGASCELGLKQEKKLRQKKRELPRMVRRVP